MHKKQKRIISLLSTVAIIATAMPISVSADIVKNVVGGGTKPLKLQYMEPAEDNRTGWEHWALPLGNGNMGAMVFGRTDTERIQMNEKTLWSGGPGGTDDAEGGEYETRDPLSDAYGNVDAWSSGAMESYIDYLFESFYSGATTGSSPAQSGDQKILPNNRSALGDYQNFAELYMDFNHPYEETSNYRRELDLRTALSTVSYEYNGVTYQREMFANYPSNVMVYRITADEPGSIDMVFRPTIPSLGTVTGAHSKSITKEGTVIADEASATITMQGKIIDNDMEFAGLFRVENEGGTVTAQNPEVEEFPQSEGQLTVTDADSVVIYVTLATNYKNEYPDYRQDVENYAITNVTERMNAATEKGYDALYEEHLDDYQELFSRVELDLRGTYDSSISTDRLLDDWNAAVSTSTQNHYLEELYFQYGRYMMIASSRSDTLPSNLQGIWNDRSFPDWQADYHTNINLQMNYWPAFVTNLSEIGESLVNYVDSLQEPGSVTANKLFGTTDAWMVNCSANALGFTGNINSSASLASTANAFILQNVYDYYQFTQDKTVLQNQIYPMMIGACNFFLQVLQPGWTEADSDKLYMVPSYSSEHGIWTVGAYFDQQLIYLLFKDTLDAADELGISDDFTSQLEETMERLYPIVIGESGQIKEWQQEGAYNRYENNPDTKIGEDAHRHNSQLMVLHPGNMITTETEEWMEAAKTTLTYRGDGASGWSMGQKLNMWARLQDGNHAYTLFKNLMKNGTHENLFDNCPPFQIDGNFGGTAGIAELLLQSHAGYVSILPALPDEMSSGSVKGLVAEGNFVVDIDWANMEPTNVSVTSRSGNRLSLKCGAVAQVVDVTSGNIVTEISQDSNGAISFDTEAGHTYQVVPGEEASLMAAQNLVDEIESKGIVSYMYSSETSAEFEEAFMACKRMVEQGNYMISDVDKVMQRLVDAENALQRREGEEYSAAAALRFLENAASVNYEGSETEDQWRQQIEYERTDLIEALENGTMSGSELLSAARTLAETGNEIAGYSSMRNNLFDLIQKAASLQQESRTDEEWAEYQKAVDQAVQIYANPNAEEKDLQAAYDRLKATVDTMTTTFTIHASSEGTGSISPDGTVTVLGGASQEFLIEPEENAEILDVLVDGMSVGAVSSYVFQNVSADGTIKADFVRTEEEKTEVEILLDQAIERAESLNEEDYSSATWLNLQNALADAKSTDRTDPQDMQEKAETLLNAMDSLIIWGEAERTEAEVSGLYPVADYSNSSVYNDPSNWGDKELTEGGTNPIGGYPKSGPKGPGSGVGRNGEWVQQEVTSNGDPASGNWQVISKTDGAWVKFGFRGGRVRYITETAAQGARVDVYIDDVFVTSVDCFTNDTSRYDRNYVAFDSDDYDIEGLASINLNDGEFHVLKLVGHYDARNSKYSNSIFRVDAFDTYPDAAQVTATSDLLKLTAKAEALSEKMYTAESWERLRAALKNAETVFGNAASTEETVSVALKELQDAMDGLEETDMNIIAVTPLMLVEVPYEITAEELNSLLQQSVVVETTGGVKERVPVEWDLQKFDGNKAGTVTLKGELILDDNQVLQNIDGLEAEISVTVLKGEAQILLGNLEQTEGQVTPVTADTVPEGLEVSILYDGVATLPENAGSYQVTAEIIDNDYTGSAQGLLVIQAKEPENPGTDPEDPGVTDPDDPGVTDPEDTGVTDPDNPGATDPDDLGTGDPDDSDTTDSDKPGTIKPDKPGTGDNSGKNQNVGSTDTGDNWNSTVFVLIILASGIGIIALGTIYKKYRK